MASNYSGPEAQQFRDKAHELMRAYNITASDMVASIYWPGEKKSD